MDLGNFLNLPVLIIAAALVALLVAVLVYAAQVAKPAPARPSGPPTGAAAMERKVGLIFAMIFAMGLIFLAYGIKEPARQAEAKDQLLDVEIGRGIANYTTLCFGCHGEKGQGAVVPDVTPLKVAPPLNRADLRPTDPDERAKMYDFLDKTISRGRPGTPMPAWSQTDGGALLPEQVNDLALMVLNGDRTITYEGQTGTVWTIIEGVVKQHVDEGLAKMPEQPQIENLPFFQALNDQEKNGVRTIVQKGCGSCHTIPNIPGASGTIGPNLAGVADRKQIAGGAVPNNSPDDLAKWIENPPALKPGTAMPNLGLTPQQAQDVAAYLYTLHAGQ